MENVPKELTKREWYAGLAMQELIFQYPSKKFFDIACVSFQYADAMLTESAKNEVKAEGNESRTVANML